MTAIYILAGITIAIAIGILLLRLEWSVDRAAWRLGTRIGDTLGSLLPRSRRGSRLARPSNRELSEPADKSRADDETPPPR
ncbi:MAG: hypothetical protein EON57_01030 [Alphaproteobacteria bacterium]|nr:MAG: hypothetical protein EON57_01030 [Alphaproteobacteria bacterium]